MINHEWGKGPTSPYNKLNIPMVICDTDIAGISQPTFKWTNTYTVFFIVFSVVSRKDAFQHSPKDPMQDYYPIMDFSQGNRSPIVLSV